MNLEMCPYKLNEHTKQAIKNINGKSVYTHIPNEYVNLAMPKNSDYAHMYNETLLHDACENFSKNVVDGFIIMPHIFLWMSSYEKYIEILLKNANVYHIMLNEKIENIYDVTVTIFCKKGKTTFTSLSFEKNPNIKINVSLWDLKNIDLHRYMGLVEKDLISIKKKKETKTEEYFVNLKQTNDAIKNKKSYDLKNLIAILLCIFVVCFVRYYHYQ